jgi:hypothetical protein
MQPLILTIPGSYYDSQIYSGYLYLWGFDGSMTAVNWGTLVQSITVESRLRFALACGLERSEYLYGDRWKLFFQDDEVRDLIRRKFEDLAVHPIEISRDQLEKHVVERRDNPFPFPHADSTIYYNMLYVGSSAGVSCENVDMIGLASSPKKLSDLPALSLAAGSSRLAVSAGSEGLYQFTVAPDYQQDQRKVLSHHSSFVRWLRLSLFSSSYVEGGYFAEFRRRRRHKGDDPHSRPPIEQREVLSQEQLFNRPSDRRTGFTWGSDDRLCFADEESVQVVRYTGRVRDPFEEYGTVPLGARLGTGIVGGDSAVFGFILELEDKLLVLSSSLEPYWINGEPVNWRVFPRSKYYTNQLHVIKDDNLSIYSFNDDYFVDQRSKRVGIEMTRFKLGDREDTGGPGGRVSELV